MNDQARNPNRHANLSIRASGFWVCFLLLAATIFVYWPVRHFAFVNFDDPQYVCANSNVLQGITLSNFAWAFHFQFANWAPVTMLSYLLDVRFFGPKPGPMHVENVLIHAMAACGWYLLLLRMTSRPRRCFVVAALFALHPAHVESVAWISERKDVLSMLLMVLSLLCYCRYTRKHSAMSYTMTLVLYALALMAKAVVVTQPLLMLLIDLWPLQRADTFNPTAIQWRRLLIEKIPFFILAIAVSVLAVKAQSAFGATHVMGDLSLQERFAGAILNDVRYLGMAFYPHDLSVFYPYQYNPPISAVIAAAALLVLISGITLRAWPSRPYLLIGWLWFLITLMPVIGLIQVGMQSIADRYTYLPFIGLSISVVWLLADLLKFSRTITVIFSAAAIVACAVATSRLLPCWTNAVTLFTHAEASVQPDWNIEDHLAAAYTDAGQPYPAIEHYEISLQLKDDLYAHSGVADLLMRYSPADALPHYKAEAHLDPLNATAHYNYAICLEAVHQDNQAAIEFQRALQLNPQLTQANKELAKLKK